MAFTCGHFFGRRQFIDRILPEFERRGMDIVVLGNKCVVCVSLSRFCAFHTALISCSDYTRRCIATHHAPVVERLCKERDFPGMSGLCLQRLATRG